MTLPKRKTIALGLALGLPPLLLGLAVYRQGFNYLDDGLWVLGAKLLGEGDILYRDLFSIYGPARYTLLVPLFLLVGKSVLALAWLKALTDVVAAALGYVFARRLGAGRLAWLAPLGVMALGPQQPRYVAAGLFAFLVAEALSRRWRLRGWLAVGVAWGLLAQFGLDAAGYGGVILALGSLLGPTRPRWRITVPAVGAGLALGLAPLVIWLGAHGALGLAWWDTVVYPATRFSGGMNLSWLKTMVGHPELGQPFAQVFTGEQLAEAWPGHSAMMTWAVRFLYVMIWVVPPLCFWQLRRSGKDMPALAAPAVALALCGWVTLLGRSDIAHMKVAWLGSLWLVPVVLAGLPGNRRICAAVAVLVSLVGFGAPIGEKLWLTAHSSRVGLELWQRPAAQVLMSTDQIRTVEDNFAQLDLRSDEPVLIWPAQPGWNFVMDIPLATSQATLLGGEIHDENRVVEELRLSRPRFFVQGRSRGLMTGVRTIQKRIPVIWRYLRHNYYQPADLNLERDEIRVLARVEGDGRGLPADLPLLSRLAHSEQTITNCRGPAMKPGLQLGQILRVGQDGFSGIVVSWDGDVPGTRFTVNVCLHEVLPAGGFRRLACTESEMQINSAGNLFESQYLPIKALADRDILVTFEVISAPGADVYLRWHVPLEGDEYIDFYPEGHATYNGRDIPGDLYFLSY